MQMGLTDKEKKLTDEQMEVYRRMIARNRQKIIALTRQKNQQDYFFESFDFRITNESG
jgi:hypothetical protein